MLKSLKFFILFLFATISFNTLVAQDNFEGKVKFKISSEEEDGMTMDYYLKDGNFRMEMGDAAKGTVFIYKGENSYILMPEEKMYMDLNNSLFSKLKDMMGKGDDDEDEKTKDINFEDFKTGKTKTILGYECQQWIMKDVNEDDFDYETEAWITDELGNFMLMKNPMGEAFSPSWSSSMKNNGFFPLLVITRNSDGEEQSRFEALEIDKKSLSSDLFGIPAGYSEMKIPGM